MLLHGSDSKITYRHSWNGHSSTTTKYYQRQGERSRLEFPPPSSGYAAKPGDQITYVYGHRTVTIYQCDRRRVINLDLDAREYTTYKLNRQRFPTHAKPYKVEPSGGTLTVTIETIDTGDGKEVFGYTARHIITHQKQVPGPTAISRGGESERDAWYIDLDVNEGCVRLPRRHATGIGILQATSNGPGGKMKADKIEVHRSGPEISGFPVEITTLSLEASQDGTSKLVPIAKMEVIELTAAPLDPALFEVPAGFKKVRKLKNQPPVPPSLQRQGLWNRLRQSLSSMFR